MVINIIIILITIVMSILAFIRNNWVFSRQLEVVHSGNSLEYLSYLRMFLKFWIWDVEKLKRK